MHLYTREVMSKNLPLKSISDFEQRCDLIFERLDTPVRQGLSERSFELALKVVKWAPVFFMAGLAGLTAFWVSHKLSGLWKDTPFLWIKVFALPILIGGTMGKGCAYLFPSLVKFGRSVR